MRKSILLAGAMLAVVGVGTFASAPEPRIAYLVEVSEGDTVWGLCEKVSTGKDDMSYLVYQTMKENNISNAASLKPGKEIVIRPVFAGEVK